MRMQLQNLFANNSNTNAMEQSFRYYVENTYDSTNVEMFRRYFTDELDLLPEKVCSYRIIFNICINRSNENSQYRQSILNSVWKDYFKLKINGKLGSVNKKKIEFEDETHPIR